MNNAEYQKHPFELKLKKAAQTLSLETRQRLARTGDDSADAAAIRLRAARFVAGVGIGEIPGHRWGEPSVEHIEAAEAGQLLPNYALQSFFWRRLGIKADFFDMGAVHQVPIEIEAKLFAALKNLADKGDT